MAQLCKMQLAADAGSLKTIRETVKKHAAAQNCDPTLADKLALAVNEAVSNIIRHAYCGDKGDIIFEMLMVRDDLIFRIRDFAQPVDKNCLKSRNLDEIRPGGLGLHFMHSVMDEVQFTHCKNEVGNILEMRKQLERSE